MQGIDKMGQFNIVNAMDILSTTKQILDLITNDSVSEAKSGNLLNSPESSLEAVVEKYIKHQSIRVFSKINMEDLKNIWDFVNLYPLVGNKFLILTSNLSNSVSNAMLKFLEEPPPHVFIFLITSNLDSLVSTVRSRGIVIALPSYVESSLKLKDSCQISSKHNLDSSQTSSGFIGNFLKDLFSGDANLDETLKYILSALGNISRYKLGLLNELNELEQIMFNKIALDKIADSFFYIANLKLKAINLNLDKETVLQLVKHKLLLDKA